MKIEHIKMIIILLIFLILSVPICSSFPIENKSKTPNEKLQFNDKWTQEIGEYGVYKAGFGVSSNLAPRGMGIYNGELYIGTQNLNTSILRFLPLRTLATSAILIYKFLERIGNIRLMTKILNIAVSLHGIFSDGCELWKYNNTVDKWTPIVSDQPGSIIPAGFRNSRNWATSIIKTFKGNLYVGTATSALHGFELWRYNGLFWKRIVKNGFGNRFNSGAWSAAEYNDELYLGTMNWKTGCEIWKTEDGDCWEKVIMPCGDGFGTIWNIYIWSMYVYNNSLFVGTCNLHPEGGCQLWRYDGVSWGKMDLPGGDGFGEPTNYGIRNMVEYRDELIVSIASNVLHEEEACEIWRFDGKEWNCEIGEEGILGDGFGNLYNKYPWSMIVTSDDKLWVGTWNLQPLTDGIPFSSTGCEIWCYDGNQWNITVGKGNNNVELSGGFGNRLNAGARSMIEYPEKSGDIWVSTLNVDMTTLRIFNGCEIWKRN